MTGLAADGAAVALPRARTASHDPQPLDAVATAWLLALPCALATALAMLLLGPPLAHVAFAKRTFSFWSYAALNPEPIEETRYLIALGGPLLLTFATVAALRWWHPRLRAPDRLLAGRAVQLIGAAFVVDCVIAQHHPPYGQAYFSATALAVAALIAVTAAVAAGSSRVRERGRAVLQDRLPLRIIAALLAAVATAIWVAPAVNTDESIAWAHFTTQYHAAFSFDETFAVLNGLTPLATFTAQYGSLWPYLVALVMLVFGKTLLVFTIAMSTISATALFAVYGVLRRAAGSAAAALVLYLPFLATSLMIVDGTREVRHSFGTYVPMWPLRYGGPYLLAWLTARQLERRGRSHVWPLFLASGLVMINNVDFGVPAFGATLAALAWAGVAPRRSAVGRLALSVAAGLAGAVVIVSAITLARAHTLPDLARDVEFARIYGAAGFNLIALPAIVGLPLVIFLTYVAAIATATVRALQRDPNRILTGMLAWSGVFGLGSADYYVARSYYEVLQYTFSVWAFALALLALAAVRGIAASRSRLPSIAALAALFGIGIAACTLYQVPLPWAQLDRITTPPTDASAENRPYVPPADAPTRRFISSIADGSTHHFVVRKGAPTALFMTTGHRMADAYGIDDVVPYTGLDSINTEEQLDETLRALRDAGGNTVVLPIEAQPPVTRALARHGFVQAATSERFTKWVDTRHLHAAALE